MGPYYPGRKQTGADWQGPEPSIERHAASCSRGFSWPYGDYPKICRSYFVRTIPLIDRQTPAEILTSKVELSQRSTNRATAPTAKATPYAAVVLPGRQDQSSSQIRSHGSHHTWWDQVKFKDSPFYEAIDRVSTPKMCIGKKHWKCLYYH